MTYRIDIFGRQIHVDRHPTSFIDDHEVYQVERGYRPFFVFRNLNQSNNN